MSLAELERRLNAIGRLRDPLRSGFDDPFANRPATLAPEEEQSLISLLGDKAMSGLGFVADTLAKPARVAWALPSGKPRELLNLIPFSDSLGLTDASDQASASATFLDKDAPWYQKLPLDILGDPSLYFGGAIAKGVGGAAKQLGAKGVAAIPGAKAVGKALRLEDIGLKAHELFDASVQGAKTGWGQKLAREDWLGVPKAQVAAKQFGSDMAYLRNAHGFAGNEFSDPLRSLLEVPVGNAAKEDAAIERMLKMRVNPATADPEAAGALRKIRELDIARDADLAGESIKRGTLNNTLNDPEARHVYRDAVGINPTKPPPGVAQPLSTKTPMELARDEALVGLPGATETFQAIARDPDISRLFSTVVGETDQEALEQIGKAIKAKYPQVPDTYQTHAQEAAIARAASRASAAANTGDMGKFQAALQRLEKVKKANAPLNRPTRIAEILSGFEPEARSAGIFANDPLIDIERGHLAGLRANAHADQITDVLAKNLLESGSAEGWREGPRVPEVLKDLGVLLGSANKTAGVLKEGGLIRLAEKLGFDSTDPELIADVTKSLRRKRVPRDVADELLRITTAGKAPSAVGPIMQKLDSASNAFKSLVTSPWLAFGARNLTSGQFRNIQEGTFGVGDFLRGNKLIKGAAEVGGLADNPAIVHEAERMVRSGVAKFNPAALSDAEAADVARIIARQHGVTSSHQGEIAQVVGRASEAQGAKASDLYSEFAGGLGGGQGPSLKRVLRKYGGPLVEPGTSYNPLDLRGVGGRTETHFGPAAGGEELNRYVESLNRVPGFLNLTRKGMDPLEAAAKIGRAQTDYGARHFTPFERNVMSRVAPFYKFSASQSKYIAKELAANPGGRLAQTLKATNAARGEDPTLPDYIANTTSIPIPEGTPVIGPTSGNPRYLTGLGLMHEDPLSFVGSPKDAGLELLSRMNPLLKAPLEYITGQSFFQKGPTGGRPLEDMDPLLGRLGAELTGREKSYKLPQALEVAAANSPASRVLSTARTALDPRKNLPTAALNLLTGLRFSDVRPEAQDAKLREMLQAAEKELGAKSFQRTYFPKEDLAQMSPQDRAAATEQQILMNMLADRAKKRAEKKKLQSVQNVQ